MHLYGGNGKKGRHAANNKHRQESRPAGGNHIEEERSARVELDYYEEERRERAERRERQARRAESSSGYESGSGTSYAAEPQQRFSADDYVSREERKSSHKWVKRLAVTLAVLLVLGVGVYCPASGPG